MTTTLKRTARIAGLLYLAEAITAAFGIMVIPSRLIVSGDVSATAQNIINHEFLFRSGIFCGFVSQIISIFLALTLYNLFEKVSLRLSRALLALVIASVPVAFFILFNEVSALAILKENYLNSFDQAQKFSMATSKMALFENGIVIIGFFWGLWLIPFGQLVFRSGFIPKVFGILLIAGGLSYLIDVTAFLLVPGLHVQTKILVAITSGIAEISMVLWLLIKGRKASE